MKVWMWQRLFGEGYGQTFSLYREREDDGDFNTDLTPYGLFWLCPKPNLVLVDRKHLGGME